MGISNSVVTPPARRRPGLRSDRAALRVGRRPHVEVDVDGAGQNVEATGVDGVPGLDRAPRRQQRRDPASGQGDVEGLAPRGRHHGGAANQGIEHGAPLRTGAGGRRRSPRPPRRNSTTGPRGPRPVSAARTPRPRAGPAPRRPRRRRGRRFAPGRCLRPAGFEHHIGVADKHAGGGRQQRDLEPLAPAVGVARLSFDHPVVAHGIQVATRDLAGDRVEIARQQSTVATEFDGDAALAQPSDHRAGVAAAGPAAKHQRPLGSHGGGQLEAGGLSEAKIMWAR